MTSLFRTRPTTPNALCTSAFAFRIYPSVKDFEYAASAKIPPGRSPVPAATLVISVFQLPRPTSAFAKALTGISLVPILTLAPNAPAPLADVPSPLWSCTSERMLERAGILTQKTSCDSASLSVMPLKVTLIWLPFTPRTVILEYPSPVPPSLIEMTEGWSDSVIGSEFIGFALSSSSLGTLVKVTGVISPALDTVITTVSRCSTFSCALATGPAAVNAATNAAATAACFKFFFILFLPTAALPASGSMGFSQPPSGSTPV